jgi:hypothetical protein
MSHVLWRVSLIAALGAVAALSRQKIATSAAPPPASHLCKDFCERKLQLAVQDSPVWEPENRPCSFSDEEKCQMKLRDEFRETQRRWSTLGFYQRFEQTVLYILTALIAVVVAQRRSGSHLPSLFWLRAI